MYLSVSLPKSLFLIKSGAYRVTETVTKPEYETVTDRHALPQNKAAIDILDEWFEDEPTEPTPEPEPFKIGRQND